MKVVNCYHAIIISRLFLPVSGYLNGSHYSSRFFVYHDGRKNRMESVKKVTALIYLVTRCHYYWHWFVGGYA